MLQGIGNLHWHHFLMAEITDKDLSDTINKCRNTSAHIDDKRTAIDLTILKGDLEKTGGQARWVGGTNMVSDSLSKDDPGFPL